MGSLSGFEVGAWAAALESGDYKQGRTFLHCPQEDTYCCLGVLCAINEVEIGSSEGAAYDWLEEKLPQGYFNPYTSANDSCMFSFTDIAKMIRHRILPTTEVDNGS